MATDTQLDQIFSALSDPTRRALVARLLDGDATLKMLAVPFDISLAAISKHLAILIRAGLVEERRMGREKWCRLNERGIAPALAWMESFGHIALQDLDGLEDFLASALDDPEEDHSDPISASAADRSTETS